MIDVEAILPDLPPEVVSQLELGEPNRKNTFAYREFTDTVRDLLFQHEELDVNQLTVGIWQKTGVVCLRRTLLSGLSRLVKLGEIEKSTRSKYRHKGKAGVPAGFRDPFGPAKNHAL